MVLNAALIDKDLGDFGSPDPIPDYAEFDHKDKKLTDGPGTNFYVTIETQQGTSAHPDYAGPVRIKPMNLPFRGRIIQLRYIFHGTIPERNVLVAIRNMNTGKVISKVLGPGGEAAVFQLNEYFDENTMFEFIAQALDTGAGTAKYYISIIGETQQIRRR